MANDPKKIELSVRDSLSFSDSSRIDLLSAAAIDPLATMADPLYKPLDPIIYRFDGKVAYLGIVTAALWQLGKGWVYRVRCGVDDSAYMIPEKEIVKVVM